MENWIFSTHVTFKGFVALFYCLLAFDVPHEMRKIRSACFFLFSSMHADCNFIQHVKFTTMHICTKLHFDAAPAPAAAVTTRRAFLFSSSFIFFHLVIVYCCHSLTHGGGAGHCYRIPCTVHFSTFTYYIRWQFVFRLLFLILSTHSQFFEVVEHWAKTVCAQIFYLWFVLFGHESAKRESKRDFGLA